MRRRELLKTTALAGTAGPALRAAARPVSANDRIGIALIGCGGMGRMNLADFLRVPAVRTLACCDVWETNLKKAVEVTGGQAQAYRDYRRVLERRDIDAVIVATPDHWHPLIAVHACQAGKDVYVEKPVSRCIREGRLMVEAARRHNRVVQVGLQQRSGTHFQRAVRMVQKGEIGKVHYIQCWNHEYSSPEGMGNPADSDPPADLDWDFWTGPARLVPFNKNRFGGTFRWFFDYGGGKIADWGSHLIDIALWAMQAHAPTGVTACGGKFYMTDNRDTPDTLHALYDFPGFVLSYSTLIHNTYGHNGDSGAKPFGSYGVLFHGSLGTLFVDRAGFAVTPQAVGHNDPRAAWFRDMDDLTGLSMYYTSIGPFGRGTSSLQHMPHVQNFIDCMHTRQRPISDIEYGHWATAACHLGNIAYRTGQKILWDGEREQVTNSAEAHELVSRTYRKPWTLEGL